MCPAQWLTPLNAMQSKQETWQKIENTSWEQPKIDPSPEISFFNNPIKSQWKSEYDRFFAYTKIFPLWDQKKVKENSQNLNDIHENISHQEKRKSVPVLTSMNYGHSLRPLLETAETQYRKVSTTRDFYRKQGVMPVKERKVHQ